MASSGIGPSASTGPGRPSTAAVSNVPAAEEVTLSAAAVLNADLLAATDVRGYKFVAFQLVGTFVATITLQQSNDNITWYTLQTYDLSTGYTPAVPTRTVVGIYGASLTGSRYIRLRATAYTSGSVGGVLEFSSFAPALQSSGAFAYGSVSASVADAQTNSINRIYDTNGNSANLGISPFLYNGTAWDKQRGNYDVTAVSSAAYTTTQTMADQTNWNGRGINVLVNTTVFGTGSVTVAIQGRDVTSGSYYTILSSAAIVATGQVILTVYPGLPAVANTSANAVLPRTWRIVATANNANSQTYSVGASVIL